MDVVIKCLNGYQSEIVNNHLYLRMYITIYYRNKARPEQ